MSGIRKAVGVCVAALLAAGGAGAQAPTKAKPKSATKSPASGARQSCDGGITLKLNASAATQGGLLLAEATGTSPLPELKAEWNGRELEMWRAASPKNTARGLIGVDLELEPKAYDWVVRWTGADGHEASCKLTVTVKKGNFPIERLTVEKQFVEPDPEQEKKAEEDSKKMKAVYATMTPEKLWSGKFQIPLKDVTTGKNFGRRRVLNGQPRSPHTGVDLPAPSGTPVYASQSGRVMLAENLFYAGNAIIIDHGYGIFTFYAHLSEIDVKPGEMAKAGQEIGKVGATGRVTGPHLHWGLTVDHARVNAMLIARMMP